MVEEIKETVGVLPGQNLSGAGYCSHTNLDYAKMLRPPAVGGLSFSSRPAG